MLKLFSRYIIYICNQTHTYNKMKHLSLAAILLFPLSLFAGGFQIPQQSIKATGLGGAFTAVCTDPASVFYNPGGMSNLSGQNITLGMVGLIPSVSVLTPDNVNTNGAPAVFTPIEFYYSGRVWKNLYAGLSINNQFGAAAAYPNDWYGMYIVQTIKLQTFMFQPTLDYKICDKLSIGAGFVYTTGTFSATKAVPLASTGSPNGEASLSGSGSATGYNVGIFSKLFEKKGDSNSSGCSLTLGVDYRSGLPFSVSSGSADFTDIPASLASTFPASENFSTNVQLPGVLSAGLAYKFSKGNNWDFMIAADFNYTFWKSYDSLRFNFSDTNTPSSTNKYGWTNASAERIGIEATYKKKISVRVGFYNDGSPVPDGSVSPEVVDKTNAGFSLGASYKFNCGLSIDAAYLLSDFIRSNTYWNYEGFGPVSYHRIVNVVGLGINYTFNCTCKKPS
jgi:long-chain fatty acid transport protein